MQFAAHSVANGTNKAADRSWKNKAQESFQLLPAATPTKRHEQIFLTLAARQRSWKKSPERDIDARQDRIYCAADGFDVFTPNALGGGRTQHQGFEERQ